MRSIVRIVMIAIIGFPLTVFAQNDSTGEKQKASLKLGIYYNNQINYYGRTDSLRSSAIFPMAELWLNRNFYLTVTPVFTINPRATEYAGSVATVGLRYFKEKKYIANVFFVKPIYKESSRLVQSALKAQAAANYTWLNEILNVTAGADIKLSDQLDYGVSGGVDHIFRKQIDPKTVFVIDPSFYVFTGTQQFTKTSYKQSGFLFFPGVQQQITEEVSKFNILSFEASAPVVLARGNWQLIFNPAYVMPKNLVRVEGRPDISERGRDMFYFTTGVRLSL